MNASLLTDRLSTLLLCSHLALPKGANGHAKPLSAIQWRSLLDKIAGSVWQQPGDLLGQTAREIEVTLALKPDVAERIAALLDRAGQIVIELERLSERGIWTVTLGENGYPPKLARRLQDQTPPVLFGAGLPDLLTGDGPAIVGSRDLDADGDRFARRLGERCGIEELTVFSGGARGADRTAMLACAEGGGQAAGVLAESLERTLRDQEFGRLLRADRLVLVTPFHPGARFDVGNAMGRNKLIYALADAAVVVSSAAGSGGTWAGAVENLKKRWVPLFVRTDDPLPAGNHALILEGGIPLSLECLPPAGTLLRGLLDQAEPPAATVAGQSRLF